ncbi:MAG: acyltransferase [Candidatus Ozemobacteraceae bacterium]
MLVRVLGEELWSVWQWLFLFWPGRLGHIIRGVALGHFFEKAGKGLTVKENVEIWHPQNLTVGNNCGIGRNCAVNCVGKVVFGDNVRLGPNVMITTLNHADSKSGMICKTPCVKPVHIGSNVWIGFGVAILPGAQIGNNCLVGAMSVINKTYPDNSVIVGNPGKVLSTHE